MSKRMNYILTCARSGLVIGKLEYETVAGHVPYLSHWDGMVALHPIFSLDRAKQLAFCRSEWQRLAKALDDHETTDSENALLQVSFLAILHSLGSIIQDAPSLPPLNIVQNNMNRLFALSYWHYYLNSKRFAFPEFKINRFNANDRFENINHYIDACYAVKTDYEESISELVEKEKVDSAERALKALRNTWITPIGNKALWRWVRAHLPAKYAADAQGWMSTIFLGSERTILDFDKDEIELMTEIIVSECPPGTAILKPVRERLDKIMQVYTDNKEAFTVNFEEYETAIEMIVELVAPKQSDFPTKAAFFKASALFYLQQRAREQQAERTKKTGGNDL